MRINTGFYLVFSKNDLFLKYVRNLYVFHEIFIYLKVINLTSTLFPNDFNDGTDLILFVNLITLRIFFIS